MFDCYRTFHLWCTFTENVSGQLKDQTAEVQEGHQAILDDLAVVRGSAQDIYHKMGDYSPMIKYLSFKKKKKKL